MKQVIKYTDFLSFFIYQRVAYSILLYIRRFEWLTPNKITLFALISGLLSAFAVVKGKYLLSISLLQFSFVLDCLDGQLARYRDLSSEIGMWFDNIVDRVVENSIIVALITTKAQFQFGIYLVFINMFYSYLADLELYQRVEYKKLTTKEKIIFFPIYLLNRSFVMLILTLSIIYFKMLYLLFGVYIYGVVFRVYRKIYGRA